MKYLFVFMLFIGVFLYSDDFDIMHDIGYSDDVFEINNTGRTYDKDGDLTPYSITSLERLSLCEGGLTLSGNTGLIELPSAFIVSDGYYNTGFHFTYTNADILFKDNIIRSKKWESIVHINWGVTQNTECGLNLVHIKNNLSGINNYDLRHNFATFNVKWSIPYKGKAVAFGVQFTNLTDEEQILLDYMDLERMNGYYIAISDQVSPRLFTNLTIKNTFIRSVNLPPIKMDRQDLIIAGAGFEYRWGYTSLLGEIKKIYGEYINDSNDVAMNVGIRYRYFRVAFDMGLVNINNGSDAVYTFGFNYNF